MLIVEAECQQTVRGGGSSPHRGRDEGRLGDLCARGARRVRTTRVDVQAVTALRRQREGDRHQLAIFGRDVYIRAFGGIAKR